MRSERVDVKVGVVHALSLARHGAFVAGVGAQSAGSGGGVREGVGYVEDSGGVGVVEVG